MTFSDFVNSITAIAVIFVAAQVYINRKQLFLSTITKCIEDFRRLYCEIKDPNNVSQEACWQYIDMTSEELFYFKHGYLPNNVAIEWVDGMIDYIPITKRKGNIINQGHCIKELSENRKKYLSGFPRIINAFDVNERYNIELIYDKNAPNQDERMKERRRLIDEILKNNSQFKHF